MPRDWSLVEAGAAAPSPDWLLLDARSSQSAGSPPGTSGQMVLHVYALAASAAAQQPAEAHSTSLSGYPGWLTEVGDTTALPPTWDVTAFIDGPAAYDYVLALHCTAPLSATIGGQAAHAACRRVWEGILAGVQVAERPPCPERATPTPGPIQWQQVADATYGYAFDIPAGWMEAEHVTGDRRVFYSDPAASGQPPYCPLPNGLLKLDCAVDPLGKAPDVAQMTPTTVAGLPAWIASGPAGDAAPNSVATLIYIRGRTYGYSFAFLCTPPSGADAHEAAAFALSCEAVVAHIVESIRLQG
ncbi:MAG: hypothetical protein ACUVX9_09630 [Anaerolineae bacterium]